jgi:hypothetical protein
MMPAMTADLLAAWAQVAAAAFAILAVGVTVAVAITDRRRSDARAARDRAEAMAAERRRWETSLLLRLAVALESGNDLNAEARAILFALGPTRLPAATFLHLGPAGEQEAAIARPETMDHDWDRARAEVAHALRHGLGSGPA